MVIVENRVINCFFQLPRTVVELQLHSGFHRPVIAFDFALVHLVIRGTPSLLYIVLLDTGFELTAEVTVAVV